MIRKFPTVSVLFPVYNGTAYLAEAIDSILGQTYTDFELIIIDDGSTDAPASIVGAIEDTRIRFYQQENKGLAGTLNRAVQLAKGKYLARQDQDDISLPTRFEKQVVFLDNNPKCGMVGTWASIIGDNCQSERVQSHPPDNLSLKFELLFDNPFVHSSMMLRRDVFEKVGLYSTDTSRQPPEDYELWSRVAHDFEVANIPEILHEYREVQNSMSRIGVNPFLERVIKISRENLAFMTGRNESDTAVGDLAAITHGDFEKLSGKTSIIELLTVLYQAKRALYKKDYRNDSMIRKSFKLRFRSVLGNYLRHKDSRILSKFIAGYTKMEKLFK